MAMNKAKRTYDLAFYAGLVERFLQTGVCEPPQEQDPLYVYLASLMADPWLKVQVLSSEICARIFRDNILQFIQYYVEKDRYNLQKNQAETLGMAQAAEWASRRRRNGWQALVEEVGEKYIGYGFDAPFYLREMANGEGCSDDALWEKMLRDWEAAFQRQRRQQQSQLIAQRQTSFEQRLRRNLHDIPEYLEKNRIEKDEFFQSWGMMDGIWNTHDFERFRQAVRLQRRYPVLQVIADRMGRVADIEGHERMFVGQGNELPLEHASRSDIEGVALGNDLNALLPGEWAQYMDSGLEDAFLYRYLSRKLQVFRHKSQALRPARTLESRPARLKGPMVVCLDTSGSMEGTPEKIAASLLIKLVEMADRQRRDCYLIAFSVSVRPIDVCRQRAKLLDFFTHSSTGGTDATQMLETTFRLLSSRSEYFNADVLWISDFKIPLCRPALLEQLIQWRKRRGVCFYGLQIGKADNAWLPFFDRIYTEGYVPPRKN